MKLMKVSMVLVCGVALMMSAAQAATTKGKVVAKAKTDPMKNLPRIIQPAFEWKELAKKYNDIDGSEYSNRAPAGEPTFTADYLELKGELDAIEKLAAGGRNQSDQSKDYVYQAVLKFDAFLAKWAERAAPGGQVRASTLSNDTRFVVAHLLPLVEMKSMIPRLIKVVSGAKIIRQSAVEQIQDAFSDMKLYFPKSAWEVGFAYVTEPVEGMGPEFADESEYQAFVADKVYARIQQGIELLENIGKMSPATTIGWDNRLVYGLASFTSAPGERYFLLRDPDRLAAIARMSRQQYEISLGAVYNNSCSVELAQQVGTLYGVEIARSLVLDAKNVLSNVRDANSLKGLISTIRDTDRSVLAPTRKDRADLVRVTIDRFPACFRKNPNATLHVNNAIASLQKSVSYGYWTWSSLVQATNYSSPFIDPAFFKGRIDEARMYFGNIARAIGLGIPIAGYETKGDTFISMMSGNSVRVAYHTFLLNLPEDSRDLMPDGFEADNGYFANPRTVSGKPVQVRNWARSRPSSWNATVYAKLFPELEAQAKSDPAAAGKAVPEKMRTWTESRGGASISEFVQNFVR